MLRRARFRGVLGVLGALLALAALPVLGALGRDGAATASAAAAPDPAAARRATAARLAAEDIADIPVRFRVVNRNRSGLACNTDGRTYTIRGHLTAPARLLAGTSAPAVTFYQHGLAAGEWYWRIDVPGYHHSEELARRGHASLTIDRLGYGASDKPDGRALCLGGDADMTHQIVQQLRAGTYRAERAEPVRFDDVVLAGHDRGAQIAEIAAYSFRDVDGLVLTGWSDSGLTDEDDARFFAALTSCMQGGVPAGSGRGAGGYTHFDVGARDFVRGNAAAPDRRALAVAKDLQSRHPCGVQVSQLEGVLVDTRRLPEIEVPVALVYGAEDRRVRGGEAHRARFTGASGTDLLTVAGAGHFLGVEHGARQVQDFIASWLDEKGFDR
ncbi:alpha/beta hydrolase [Streptomyces sp. VRA16 Mangrove soil]|uniref:alpha/beta hydrolase n=1 Tax=Streptomyces sp. VRA16 Mangrove soil TaxID=2817434 RepID=UPI001A9E5AF3|nr:alpha/beta hydrolase [Streptomyces sp. VRA16 Mangrove soil]MBO1334262.1 alpha/beta hydrolase [Streptomyces sp. VRA16 Mangrove soil]